MSSDDPVWLSIETLKAVEEFINSHRDNNKDFSRPSHSLFDNFHQINDRVYQAELGKIPVLLKTKEYLVQKDNIRQELVISKKLNELKSLCPSFVYTYSSLSCTPPPFSQGQPCNVVSPTTNDEYIVMEYIAGSTLADANAKHKLSQEQLIAGLMLSCSAMDLAFARFGFTHDDLHYNNIIIQKLAYKSWIPTNFGYYVYTDILPVIIDYGQSSIDQTDISIDDVITLISSFIPYDSSGDYVELQRHVDLQRYNNSNQLYYTIFSLLANRYPHLITTTPTGNILKPSRYDFIKPLIKPLIITADDFDWRNQQIYQGAISYIEVGLLFPDNAGDNDDIDIYPAVVIKSILPRMQKLAMIYGSQLDRQILDGSSPLYQYANFADNIDSQDTVTITLQVRDIIGYLLQHGSNLNQQVVTSLIDRLASLSKEKRKSLPDDVRWFLHYYHLYFQHKDLDGTDYISFLINHPPPNNELMTLMPDVFGL